MRRALLCSCLFVLSACRSPADIAAWKTAREAWDLMEPNYVAGLNAIEPDENKRAIKLRHAAEFKLLLEGASDAD